MTTDQHHRLGLSAGTVIMVQLVKLGTPHPLKFGPVHALDVVTTVVVMSTAANVWPRLRWPRWWPR